MTRVPPELLKLRVDELDAMPISIEQKREVARERLTLIRASIEGRLGPESNDAVRAVALDLEWALKLMDINDRRARKHITRLDRAHKSTKAIAEKLLGYVQQRAQSGEAGELAHIMQTLSEIQNTVDRQDASFDLGALLRGGR